MTQNSTTLPIAEHFHSYQGEGDWTGTPMYFIRTAGCNVGQHPDTDEVKYEIGQDVDFPILRTAYPAYRCHTYDGRGFWCDTDFHKGVFISIDSLIDATWEKHICITGGEPLLHRDRIEDLITLAILRGITVHIETSGTIEWRQSNIWITVSPKQGYLSSMITRADELKLLVDPTFKLEDVPLEIMEHRNVFIQPINDELHINLDNLKLCHDVLRQVPHWRLSVQLHKCFGWR
jgi:7-carboxy-7-deazaguanine synthase